MMHQILSWYDSEQWTPFQCSQWIRIQTTIHHLRSKDTTDYQNELEDKQGTTHKAHNISK